MLLQTIYLSLVMRLTPYWQTRQQDNAKQLMTAWVSDEVGSRREREGTLSEARRYPPQMFPWLSPLCRVGCPHCLPFLYSSAAPPAEQTRCLFSSQVKPCSLIIKCLQREVEQRLEKEGLLVCYLGTLHSSFFSFFFRVICDSHPDPLARGSECTIEKNFPRENVTNLFGVWV